MAFLYQTLAQTLIPKLKELPAHSKLPSLRVFAKQHHISLSTAQACYVWLEAQGYIYSKIKSSYFVQAQPKTHPVLERINFPSVQRNVSNFELFDQIQEASSHTKIIHLGAIQLGATLIPIDPLRRSIQRALKHSHSEDFLYCNRQGHLKLREAFSQLWAEDGIHVAANDILITNGCMAALSLSIQSLTQPNDAIIIPTPTFNGQLQLLASLKRKIIEVPSDTQGIDLQRLEEVMQSGQAKVCLLTANYQNPLGYCLSHIEKQKIAQLAAQYQCYIIEDDIYAECGYQQQRPLPIQYWDTAGYVIWTGSVSKSMSSAYRIGWVCLGNKTQHLRTHFLNHNMLVNTPLQLGLADFIYSGQYKKHIERLRSQLLQQVNAYIETIQKLCPYVQIIAPQGGYALWLKLPQEVSTFELYNFALQQSISIVPGIVFGEDAKYKHYIRLNAGHPLNKEIKNALKKLMDWITCCYLQAKTPQIK